MKKMKKIKKIYGVEGMMEWVALIPTKAQVLTIHFEGGCQNAFGQAPATYSTCDGAIQRLIEGSDAFRRGRVKIVAEYESEG